LKETALFVVTWKVYRGNLKVYGDLIGLFKNPDATENSAKKAELVATRNISIALGYYRETGRVLVSIRKVYDIQSSEFRLLGWFEPMPMPEKLLS